jgi:hypothetical protein
MTGSRPRSIVVSLAIACVLTACAPTSPAPLPSGATSLILRTHAPPGFSLDHSCPAALVLPVVVRRESDALVFVSADGGAPVSLVWPAGFSARLLAGRAELVTPLGNVYARDGDVLARLGGGTVDNGDVNICFTSPDEYRQAAPSR